MKRKIQLITLFIIGALFLLVQVVLWQHVSMEKSNSDNSHKKFFRAFIDLAYRNGFPLFVASHTDLLQMIAGKTNKTKCKILCKSSLNRISLGIDSRFIENRVNMLLQLSNESIQMNGFCVFGRLHFQKLHKGDVPIHCFLETQGFTVHIVVFYEINSDFLWHGAAESYKFPDFTSHQGAFSRINTKKVMVDGIQLRIPSHPRSFLSEVKTSTFVPCNLSRQAQFRSKYSNGLSDPDAKYFVLKAVEIIRQAKQVLDKLRIPFWLSSGTCLGWFRQCDIIPYSKDVDLGIFIKDYHVSLIFSMQKAGFLLKHKFGRVSDSFELSFQGDKIKLDLFFFYEERNYTWNGGTQASTGRKYKYIFPKFSLCWTYFYDMKVRVPCQTIDYIGANYGGNWFEPVEKWDWKTSPANVQPNGIWPQKEWTEVINTYL